MKRSGEIIVIGYGNTLRGDDGVGPHIAAAIARRGWPDVVGLAVPQLTPELTERLASARLVVFVDAGLDATEEPVGMSPIASTGVGPLPTHCSDPRSVLALTEVLHGHAPPAWLITVPSDDFGIREGLSEKAQRNSQEALARIEELIQRCCAGSEEPPCMKSA